MPELKIANSLPCFGYEELTEIDDTHTKLCDTSSQQLIWFVKI